MKANMQPMVTTVAQRGTSFVCLLRAWPLVFVMLAVSCASPQTGMQVNIATSKPLNFFPLLERGETVPIILMNVNSYRELEHDLTAIKRYDFEYTSKDNPLLEKELFRMLESFLVRLRLQRDRENPDVLITMNYYTGKRELYTPPQTVISTRFESVWNVGLLGWTPIGFSSVVPITESSTEPEKRETLHFYSMRLNFLDAGVLRSGKKMDAAPLLWIGEAQFEAAARENNDIRSYADALLRTLLFEFPKQSNLGPKRLYKWAIFGDIGTTLCSEDWRLVREVKRNSPADVAGIKAGDRIIAIGGKNAARGWRTYDRLADDPWYNLIMKNPGGRDVELTVQGHEDGALRKVIVTPLVQEHGIFFTRYIYTPPYGWNYGTIYDQY